MSEDFRFDMRYHAKSNQSAEKLDTVKPCGICGWSEHMAIHHAPKLKTNEGWAHQYVEGNHEL